MTSTFSNLSKFVFFPVNKLSITKTLTLFLSNSSTKCEPINPAPPVTNAFLYFMI